MLSRMDRTASALAKFERAAEAIRADIRSGALPSGEKLPATDGVAERYGIARATAQKALQVLEGEGWVTKRASVGVFVNEPPDESAVVDGPNAIGRQVAELRTTVADLVERVRKIEDQHDPS